jgi:hypothetical protein
MDKLLEFLGSLLELLWGPLVKFVKNHSKATLIIVGIIAVVAAFMAGSFFKLTGWHSKGEEKSLGGVDLAGYCGSYDFASGNGKKCFSKIDLNDACNWQYSQTGMRIAFTSSSPLSGICYTRNNEKLHGIDRMDDYCKLHYRSSIDVASKPVGKRTWLCQTTVDMNLVCNWKWQKIDVVARRDDAGNWKCYEKD